MNQKNVGAYIAKKRREKNLTQEQLAEMLSVSNKTVSKWENGWCMPDYSIVEEICTALSVSVPELLNGKDAETRAGSTDDAQMLDLLCRTQHLERQSGLLYGAFLVVLGVALGALSTTFGGSHVKDFLSGVLMGLSVGEMLVGIFVIAKNIFRK